MGRRVGAASVAEACGGSRAFLRDYAQRGTNALLWVVLVAVTWVLLRNLSALLRLWAIGSRLPSPPALLTDPDLAIVCRAGAEITDPRRWQPLQFLLYPSVQLL